MLEVLLSVAIITALAGVSIPVYLSFNNRNDLDIGTQTIATALRRAETYSRGVNGDSQWGVKVQSGSIVLFKGASYAARDTTYDENAAIPPQFTIGGNSEIVFAKLSATPSATGIITLTSPDVNETRTITINAKGMVDY
jgi:type II secretory pathway pseudopilin PulG